ncbi:PAS domain-containing sensor histidine kinase [Heyndrickxia oleronia]|jgi:two-component system, sporulation sensor kinase D|uniref:PAS domain-containing sensor histidine kinase n=1 Tax=Heyndrickxia oleronia TaxID=38875 RepID=UPI001ADEBF94|nr:PAS domain-containing sensor histidine kinase [Heyndrickxia oleronia]MCI1589535.1 ATP-binding protein [Heyndrickxia oleronia]MCI1611411.1 ATP-binding protein [Heyndrickxia oleronia]MCI1742853.1 ATP-binding protein [Heyndrickxia oleronia]MCI1759932.1 ATP-binding protein [Heyndrickxia oleronia]MEC1372834.1 ATP-binding protein [Heyndrickxia oleronia]
MKNKRKKFAIYLSIVLAPAILFTTLYGIYSYKMNDKKSYRNAERDASIYQRQMDQVIGETIKSIEVLAITFESNFTNTNDVKTALKKVNEKDPRYGGIYFLDKKGNVITGTNDYLKQYSLQNKNYLKTMELTHQTVVSDQVETLSNNQKVVAIVTPVVKNNDIQAIIVAHIRIDYIANIIQMLSPNTFVQFESTTGIPIFSTNSNLVLDPKKGIVRTSLEKVPWRIAIVPNTPKINPVFNHTFIFFLIITTIIHGLYLFLHSITIKRQTARERMQNETQKLELVGTLAASTAHEIRNPLTGIKGLFQLLSEKYKDPKDQFYFSIVNKEIDRINEIVNEFLILGKPTIQKMEEIHLDQVINDLNPLIFSESNLFNVHYSYKINSEKIIVLATMDQLKQVILNITKNALESMSVGGQLIINLDKKDEEAILSIRDNGNGISEEDLKKIFTPFFTSKENGTGLGLVVCKRIIESFNGTIEIKSKINKGTEVIITLPLQKGVV